MNNDDKKYPANMAEPEEKKDETAKNSDPVIIGAAGNTPAGFIPAAMMMCVYAGPDFWNGDGKQPGAFAAQSLYQMKGKYCSACGFPLKETDKYCTECGTKVIREENT